MGSDTLKLNTKQTFNYEYFRLWQEFPLAIFFFITKKRSDVNNTNVLIVNTCLIGEFVVSLPAISDYISRNNKTSVDILVSPANRPLAERIVGIRNVLVANSIHNREIKQSSITRDYQLDRYNKIIVLRISRDAYTIIQNIETTHIKMVLSILIKYGLHIMLSLIFRKTPKRLLSINFEMLNGTQKDISFDKIIQFTANDYMAVSNLNVLNTTKKKIIVHTNTNWIMKRWSNEKWISLLKKVSKLDEFQFIFIGAQIDTSDHKYIAPRLGFESYSLIGELDLALLLLVLRKSDYFIGIDSGPSNMAYLSGIKSITILGPGPHMYMPNNKHNVVVDKSNGRGLSQLFFHNKHGSIIDKISINEVYNAFTQIY